MRRFAWLITRVFDPLIEIPLAVGMAAWMVVRVENRLGVMLLLFLFYVVLPGIFFVVRIRKGKITDLDITRKEERTALYRFLIGSHLLGIMGVSFLRQNVLVNILLILWVGSVVFMLINTYWKISVHAGVNVFMMTMLYLLFGGRYWEWLLGILLLVMWSRVYLGKHTAAQVVGGAVVALVLIGLGMKIGGLY